MSDGAASLPPEKGEDVSPIYWSEARAKRLECGDFIWSDGQAGWRCERCMMGFRIGIPAGMDGHFERLRCAQCKIAYRASAFFANGRRLVVWLSETWRCAL
jgi:hypothetical protein